MKNEVIKFERYLTAWGGCTSFKYRKGGARLCSQTVRRAVGLPKDTTVMYAVFSDKRSANDFTITKRRACGHEVFGVDVNYLFMGSARALIQRMYQKGYHYVRIEYDA